MTESTLRIAILAFLLIGFTDRAGAQQRPGPFSRASPLTATMAKRSPLPITIGPIQPPRDYRWKGALIGGAAGVVLGAITGAVICSQGDTDGNNCPLTIVGVAALTGAPLAILGGIIGSNIERPASP